MAADYQPQWVFNHEQSADQNQMIPHNVQNAPSPKSAQSTAGFGGLVNPSISRRTRIKYRTKQQHQRNTAIRQKEHTMILSTSAAASASAAANASLRHELPPPPAGDALAFHDLLVNYCIGEQQQPSEDGGDCSGRPLVGACSSSSPSASTASVATTASSCASSSSPGMTAMEINDDAWSTTSPTSSSSAVHPDVVDVEEGGDLAAAKAGARWSSLEETRAAVHPPLLPAESYDDSVNSDAQDKKKAKSSVMDTPTHKEDRMIQYVQPSFDDGDTDDASPRSSFDLHSSNSSMTSIQTPDKVQQTLREIRLGKRRRQRQRQRDELKFLGLRVEELEGELERLVQHQKEFSEQTLVAARKLNVHSLEGGVTTPSSMLGVWKQMTAFERERLRSSVMENTRLRAQYECQLQIANGLKRLYENRGSIEALNSSPDRWFLAKKPRTETLSEDALIFASLGRDFDAQRAQADAIFDAAGLSNFDGELEDEMMLRKNEHGVFYFDNLYSKVFPFEVRTIDDVLGQCLTVERLQSFHADYKVLKATDDMIHTKAVNKFKVGNVETTLVVRVATRKYFEEQRVVAVWEGLIEAEGDVFMRLRETGWNIIRPAHTRQPEQTGPVSIEQACVRITPEVQAPSTEKKFATGTIMNLLVQAYHKRMEQVHLVADDLLALQLENMSLGD